MTQSDLNSHLIVLPPLSEQTSIANFLDEKTAKIDTAIAQKERLIDLLRERKQIIIQTAVTKGLDPTVPMKDSGVEWIGDIPAGWKIVRLGYVADVLNGTTPDRDRVDYWDDGTIPWLSSGKVNDYFVQNPSEYITEKALKECSLSLFPVGTVILGMIGQGKTRGMSASLKISACINQNLAGIVPHKKLVGGYLHQFLITSYKSIREYGRGGNQAALNCALVSSLRILLPPLEEQQAIAAHIETQSAKIEQAISLQQRQIEKLKEYKAILINSAVTGKMMVG